MSTEKKKTSSNSNNFPKTKMPSLGGGASGGGPWSPSSAASEADTEVTIPPSSAGPHQEEETLARLLQSHEDIRFASYRTAAKLRSLQKQTYLHHIDIWNMIEAFRENGLHGLDHSAKLTEARVEAVVKSLYDSLLKRLPPPSGSEGGATASGGGGTGGSHVAVLKAKGELLVKFLWEALYHGPNSKSGHHHHHGGSSEGENRRLVLKVRTVKAALATLCTGKLMDKLRYIFSQLADNNSGQLIHSRFQQFLRDIMKIPAAVGEFTSFGSDRVSQEVIFDSSHKVNVNDFLETMMSDPGPQCLSWLLVLHRLINSEAVIHQVSCGYCQIRDFSGLRYKSDRSNYHLCQNCFWRGKIGRDHQDDVFKEFNTFRASSASGRASLKKSLQCIPSEKRSSSSKIPQFPTGPEKPLDLSNLVPPSPAMQRNGYGMMYQPFFDHQGEMVPDQDVGVGVVGGDEHSLIAHYANQLAQGGGGHHHKSHGGRRSKSPGRNALMHSRQIVHDLERRNREIMQDINRLRESHNMDLRSNPDSVMSELHHLRSHKDELEERLSELQETRKELMHELGELMKLLQVQKPPGSGGGPGMQQQQMFVQQPSSGYPSMQQGPPSSSSSHQLP